MSAATKHSAVLGVCNMKSVYPIKWRFNNIIPKPWRLLIRLHDQQRHWRHSFCDVWLNNIKSSRTWSHSLECLVLFLFLPHTTAASKPGQTQKWHLDCLACPDVFLFPFGQVGQVELPGLLLQSHHSKGFPCGVNSATMHDKKSSFSLRQNQLIYVDCLSVWGVIVCQKACFFFGVGSDSSIVKGLKVYTLIFWVKFLPCIFFCVSGTGWRG